MDTEVKASIPAQNLTWHLVNALQAMPFEESDRAFKKLQHGYTIDPNEDGTATIRFKDGTAFITMNLEDLKVPPPKVTYHGDKVTLAR